MGLLDRCHQCQIRGILLRSSRGIQCLLLFTVQTVQGYTQVRPAHSVHKAFSHCFNWYFNTFLSFVRLLIYPSLRHFRIHLRSSTPPRSLICQRTQGGPLRLTDRKNNQQTRHMLCNSRVNMTFITHAYSYRCGCGNTREILDGDHRKVRRDKQCLLSLLVPLPSLCMRLHSNICICISVFEHLAFSLPH